MKEKVIKFLQNLPVEKHVQFNEAFKLYRDSQNKNANVERSLNASGYSERTLENLLYDLQKLHEITDVEKILIPEILKLVAKSDEEKDVIFSSIELVLEMSDEQLAYWANKRQGKEGDIKELLDRAIDKENEPFIVVLNKALDSLHVDISDEEKTDTELNADSTEALKLENEELKSENEDLQFDKENLESENEDLQDEVEELKTEVETLKLAPKLDAKQIRVEFPFLKEKDCPDEFKILVADKISAWNRGNEIQAEIVDLEKEAEPNKEVLAKLAKEAIECFTENKKIYDELNCYQTTGKILGVHPIFKKVQLTREIETMTNDELIKYKASSAKYFSVNKTALEKAKKAKDDTKVQEIETRVAERHDKLFLVNKKLGV